MDYVGKLAIAIGVPGAGVAVTDMLKVAKSIESEAVSADKATLANAKMAASVDKLAVSEAKLAVVQAKAVGGGGVGSAEADALAAAQSKAAMSKASSAVASDTLAVSEAKAASAAKGLGTEADGAAGMLGKMGVSGDGAAAALGKVGPAIAVFAAFKVLSDGVKGFEQLTGQVRDFQNVSGASAQQASLLVGQVNTLGIDSDLVGKAIFRLGSSIADGTSKLNKYGIEAVRTKDGSVDMVATFDRVRTAFSESTDASVKDGIAKAAYARGGAALIPLLRLTGDEIKNLNAATAARGGVFNQSDVDSGYQLKVASAEMSASLKGMEVSLAKGVVPALADAAAIVSKLVDMVNKANSFTGGALLGDPITNLLKLLGGKSAATSASAKSDAEAKVAADDYAKAVDAEAKSEDALTKAVTGEYDAKKSAAAADKAYEAAVKSVGTAQAALAKLVKDGAVDQKAVTAARTADITAIKDVEKANDALAKSQDALAKATAGATDEEMAQAQLTAAEGPDKIAKATEALQTAQTAFNALQGSGSASASELLGGQNDIVAAVHGVEQAQLDAAKATDALTVVKQKGTASDPAVISATQAVADAHDNVTSAIDRQATTAEALRTAQAGDPAFGDKLAAAQEAVATAQENVATAQDNQMSSAFRLKQASDALTDSLSANAGAIGAVRDQLAAFPGYAALLPSAADITGANGLLATIQGIFGGAPQSGAAKAASNTVSAADLFAQVNASNAANYPANSVYRGGRATGGPVSEGTYLVGEHGPEPLVLGRGQSGYVTSNAKAFGAGGTTVNITVNATTGASAAEIARQTAWSLRTVLPPSSQAAA